MEKKPLLSHENSTFLDLDPTIATSAIGQPSSMANQSLSLPSPSQFSATAHQNQASTSSSNQNLLTLPILSIILLI